MSGFAFSSGQACDVQGEVEGLVVGMVLVVRVEWEPYALGAAERVRVREFDGVHEFGRLSANWRPNWRRTSR